MLHPAIDRSCRFCHGEGVQVVRDGELARAEACSCVGRCPVCRGTGWVAAGEGFRAPRKRCTCHKLSLRLELFNNAGIPARHARSTRASFAPTTTRQTAALMGVTAYLDRFDQGQDNRGLVLHGDVGRGKTHLMVAMLRELIFRYGVSVRFVEFSHLLADLKTGFDHGRGTSRLMDPLVRVGVLGIDELGKGRNTEFEGTVLDELVSRRYNSAATILATTNYAPQGATGQAVQSLAAAAVGSAPRPTLPDRVGVRVYSRLQEMCDFVEVVGTDWREKQRQARRPGH